MPGLARHPITDKNGKATHVWRGSRVAADIIAKNNGLIDQRAVAAGTRRTNESFDTTVTTTTLLSGVTQSRDENGRLHSANGEAAVTYPDGTSDHYWHGKIYQRLRYPALTLTVQQEVRIYDRMTGGRSGNTAAQARDTHGGQSVYFWRGRPFKTEADWHAARRMKPTDFDVRFPATLPEVKLSAS